MALIGVTRSKFESSMQWLIDREYEEAARLQEEAASWDGKAEAYGNMLTTTYWSTWYYYGWSTGPSKSGQANAVICRENARVCRSQAQAHRDKANEYKSMRANVLAEGQFDREEHYDS